VNQLVCAFLNTCSLSYPSYKIFSFYLLSCWPDLKTLDSFMAASQLRNLVWRPQKCPDTILGAVTWTGHYRGHELKDLYIQIVISHADF
jgi:hypothetical protein